MKLTSTILSALFIFQALHSQVTDTVSIGSAYTQQVYYSLDNGTQNASIKNDWDLAFEVTSQGYSIWINAATGTEIYLCPGDTTDWSTLDTMGMGLSWTKRFNSDTSWTYGALSQDQGGFDVGWGTYNMITHAVVGDRLFVIKLGNGSYQKLWIKGLTGGVYTFRHASLTGGMDMTHQLDKSDFNGKNFAYYSLQFHNDVDKEPLAADWDLFFGQYTTYIPQPYLVTGVLQSMGTMASKAYPVNDPASYTDFSNHPFQKEINILGYDWKPFNMSTMMYEIVDSTVYFVKTNAGSIWKVVFLHFGGSADGNFVFTKQELVSAGISSAGGQAASFSVYPNPASDVFHLVYKSGSNVRMTVSNLAGQVLRTASLTAEKFNEEVNISDLEAGIYIVTLANNHGSVSKKLIIQ